MPYYSDLSYYYGAGPPLLNPYINPPPYASFAGYTRALTGTYGSPTLPSSRTAYSSSRYTPMLSTISEAPYISSRRPISSLTRTSPKVSMHISPKYIAPRPIPINTADIDVSASRYKRNVTQKDAVVEPPAKTSKDPVGDMDDQSPYMPRCDQDDDCEVKKPIKRDRTVVRISTMRAKSGRKSPKIAKEEPHKPIMKPLEIPPATPTETPPLKKTWRDNIGVELSPKPKDAPKKSPGERLLERHLIKHEEQREQSPEIPAKVPDFFTFDCIPDGARLEERRPSFHDICQDISSDKLETVDDLNAGELRRKASLMDQEEIFVNKVTKSASGTLHCILERHLEDAPESSVKKHKTKVKHKITCSVGIDEPTVSNIRPIVVSEEEDEGQNSTPIKVKKKLNAVVEHVEEHVVKLPKKKTKKPIQEKEQKVQKEHKEQKEQKQKVKQDEEHQDDIWSGMRETVYYNRRRQEQIARQVAMLKAFHEEAEEKMCAEIIPQETPQCVVVEKRPIVVQCDEKSASILAPVASQRDRRENSVKVSKPSQSESADAKVHSSANNGAATTASGWQKQNVVAPQSGKKTLLTKSSDNQKTLSTSADNVDGVKIPQEKECEKLTMRASLKIPNGPQAKSPEVSQNKKHYAKITDRVEKGSAAVEDAVPLKVKKSPPLGSNKASDTKTPTTSTEKSARKNARKVHAPTNEEVPPHVSNDSTTASPTREANTSEIVTPHAVGEALSMAKSAIVSEINLNDHEEIATCNSIADEEVNIFKSHSGNISKFPTFTNLNELSLDCDQSEKSMAIEVDGDRVCLGTSKIVDTPTTSAPQNGGAPSETTDTKSDEKSAKTPAETPAEVLDVADEVKKPQMKLVKKKKIVIKKVLVKRSPKSKEERLIEREIGEQVEEKTDEKAENSEIVENSTSTEPILPTNSPSAKGVFMESKTQYKKDDEGEARSLKGHRNKTREKKGGGFNPQKCMKFSPQEHKIKCYEVDEKAPRVLYATPRPLQKKKKPIDYYSSDESITDDESNSDGSTQSPSSDDEFFDCPSPPDHMLNLYAAKDVRMSTGSNDSGFEGGTAPSSPKQMFETSYTYGQYQRSGRITAPATSIPRFRKYAVEDFHFLAVLGKGSFGKVLLAELRNTEFYYAIKCLKKDVVLEDDDVECTLIERKVLALGTKHPYLCHLFCTFQTESHLFFVMEYLNGGDLMFHIQQSGRFPEVRARFYAAEIISGLKFLHKKGIIYRDLKLDNVLLDFDGHVRIADFGMCKLQIYLDRTADSFCGTPDYMAPEIIKGQKYNQAVDWWSFGVLMYEMLIGQSPFSGCDEDELFWSICNEVPWIPGYISKEGHNILKALLEKDASIRLGSNFCPLGEIVDHPFFAYINWDKLEKRELEPPFKPHVRHPLDTQYFDKTFTKERVRLTPIDKEILRSMAQDQFQGFSYTNPNATLN
ncbi:serine/threonine-protein kinase pakA isoform X2 [Lutzomyia longipalpis]|uniref:serine/threonine-protein kinase pakA isoform X2 n=1 Tax=Lutzomyia longipalpis TaxID=7200 RepID=UPI002483AE73|nr:serine/threonine-protein kinase pakA isoform X2 [Lutzomyia longipalpis]